MPDYDVLIAGGGPVGTALALALRDSGLEVAVVEARLPEPAPMDPRPIALSHGSRLILERLGVWDELAPVTPIARIHVSQRGGFGRVELDAEEARLPALGYVLDYARLARTLAGGLGAGFCDSLTGATVTGLAPEPARVRVQFERGAGPEYAAARLVAVADGGTLTAGAQTRIRDYRQAAVTARVTSRTPHRNVAYERFTPTGPLALLPDGEKLAVIWTTTLEHAQELCTLPDTEFLQRLEHAFGGRLGGVAAVGTRTRFPLALKVSSRIVVPRVTALGNAAQTLHPVAGQGLNLGLRDAWELADLVRDCSREEVGGPALLRAYAARRRLDRRGGVWFTDTLVQLFSNDLEPLRLARGLGLTLLGAVPAARNFVVRRMTFGTRG
ncbi:MAG: FAD-dependent monooxygenase [Betaproteobacteria bacterium]|nr:FAD-dependent monooxygenase [Betaproteobacteria bacterium]